MLFGEQNSCFYGFAGNSCFMFFQPGISREQEKWLQENGYKAGGLLSKGKSSGVWKVKKDGKSFAVKMEHEKSSRTLMLERECYNLQKANEVNVGPKLELFDSNAKIIVMHFIDGIPFGKWLLNCDDKKLLENVLKQLLEQAGRLDKLKLDHGQLGGKLANILVDYNQKVWIVDFEKAGLGRGTHNVSKLFAVLFKSSRMEKQHLLKVLGEQDFEELQNLFYILSQSE
jgi:putative serine/threonine protein kinase